MVRSRLQMEQCVREPQTARQQVREIDEIAAREAVEVADRADGTEKRRVDVNLKDVVAATTDQHVFVANAGHAQQVIAVAAKEQVTAKRAVQKVVSRQPAEDVVLP